MQALSTCNSVAHLAAAFLVRWCSRVDRCMLGPMLSTSSLTFRCHLLEGKLAAAPSFCLCLQCPPPCTSGLTLCEAGGECWGSGGGPGEAGGGCRCSWVALGAPGGGCWSVSEALGMPSSSGWHSSVALCIWKH